MKALEKRVKKGLFNLLTFRQYLRLVSKSYFFLYKLGALKNNPTFKYHYFMKSLVKEGDVVIDIGGNLGYFSIPFSKIVGSHGKVYSVEPVTQIREVLEINARKRKNIEIIPYALGNENKKIRMGNNSRDNSGVIATGSHFVLDEKANAADEFQAEMKKGSELFKDLTQLNFIKCDVEGYETVILPEMKNILTDFKPSILIETGKENRKFIKKFLYELGYHAFILEGKKLFPVEQIDDGREDDMLFIHDKKLESFLELIVPSQGEHGPGKGAQHQQH